MTSGGPDRTVPRTLDGDFDGAAGSPPQSNTSPLDAFFETLVKWLEKNPDAFAPKDDELLVH
jgi:hypothetical protein